MKVSGFVRDPSKKASHILTRSQHVQIRKFSRQLIISHVRMNGAMTDWMNRHGLVPTFTLGHTMMPFNA